MAAASAPLRDWNRGKKLEIDGEHAPTRNDEYLLYQTLIGTWPAQALDDGGWSAYVQRIEQYALKAAREAKEHTSWANTNSEYEGALVKFSRAVLNRSGNSRFVADFDVVARRIARIGTFNSLSQTLLKLTSPGVPDIYQGNELLEFSLVDPDNRRPVDYDRRTQLFASVLREMSSTSELPARARGLLSTCGCNAAKQYLSWKTLIFRRQNPALFQRGSYVPLCADGEISEHVVCFARKHEGRTIVVVVPRLCAGLMGEAHDTTCEEAIWRDSTLQLPDRGTACYHNLFTNECLRPQTEDPSRLRLAELFRNFPVALLVSESANPTQSCAAS